MSTANKKGEKIIEKILKSKKEFYSTKTKLYLKKDNKKYRVPDFYLHKYNLAIEYFGSWNYPKNLIFEKKERQRFLKKIDAYNSNGINCVFIYPNEINSAKEIIYGAIKEVKEGRKPLAWVIPWLYEDKIDPPRAEDFSQKEEPLNWVIPWLYEKKIEKPRAEDFSEDREPPLNWNIPWLNEKKIEEPRAEDFLEKKTKKPIKIETEDPVVQMQEEPEQSSDIEKYIPFIGVALILLIILLIMIFLFVIFFGPR